MPILLPVPSDERARRTAQLFAGLLLYGISTAFLVNANLGLDPWDVFHQGLAERTGTQIGVATIVTSAFVMLLWIPLRQRPGIGTISNAIVIGLVMDAVLAVAPEPNEVAWRALFLIGGIAMNGIATGMYIGAGLGPGPRDGLMTGWAARTGRSIRLVRTIIEIGVLVAGWALGGTIGIGTAAYALSIGPLAHIFIPLFTIGRAQATADQLEGH